MTSISRYFIDWLNRPPVRTRVAAVVEQKTLPRLIHQTFPTASLPRELQNNVDSVKLRNPSWQHVLYDDADVARFIRSAYGADIHASFNRIDPLYGAARADLFRYLLLYKMGGVYLDIKSVAARPLDEVLARNERFIVAQWPRRHDSKFSKAGFHEEIAHIDNGEFQQWFIVASPGHPFLKAVIENVLRNLVVYNPELHGVGKPGVLRLTGPVAYTLAIKPLLNHHEHRIADAEDDLGFHYSLFSTVDKPFHAHLDIFKTHYSQSKTTIVELSGLNAALVSPLRAARVLKTKIKRVVVPRL